MIHKDYSDVDLLNSLYWLGVRVAKELNSKKGNITKATIKEQDRILNELSLRYGFQREELEEKINK